MARAPDHDEAVSPVLGVILMVAITIVVAAVLFVLVRGFGGTEGSPPAVQFLRNNQDGQLTVIRTSEGIDLSSIDVRMSVAGFFAHNGQATTAETEAPARTFVPVSGMAGTVLKAGDYLSFCVSGPSETVNVDVRITSPPDVVIYQNSLTGLRSC